MMMVKKFLAMLLVVDAEAQNDDARNEARASRDLRLK
jgi:hypothetical protein